ncbi:hypothetical protein Pyn_28331 [Prunus yedoensis var. nudiflora]|uniref:Uncharacterized protein n=1 Tax=Prunus yedoensis var. nudiflora TaxID=2094558 RepID=A0A314ZIL4_PRUYE|nr:hypothetical protein Pyn_28331 [Prunus yedoensis var. nudiflora]
MASRKHGERSWREGGSAGGKNRLWCDGECVGEGKAGCKGKGDNGEKREMGRIVVAERVLWACEGWK